MAANKTMRASLIIGGAVDTSLKSALTGVERGIGRIGSAIRDAERQQTLLTNGIRTFGKQGRNVDSLREKYGRLTTQVEKLKTAHASMQRLESAQSANLAQRDRIRSSLGATVAASVPVVMSIRSAASRETALLGVAKQLDGARDSAGRLTPVYYDMVGQIERLGHEIPIATNEIAGMTAASLRMGVAGRDAVGFTRNVAMLSTAFDAPAEELATQFGRISTIFKLPVSNMLKLGDAVNYLDDNAMAQGADILKVLQGDLAGAAATMGLSAQNAAALASTMLTLGESAETADTAASGMLRQLQIAKMNPAKFQQGAKMIGMTGDQLQTGMVTDAQGTILRVLERINRLDKKDQMEAVTRLFGKDWGGAIGKLANGIDEYKRQLQLANGTKKDGSVKREFDARIDTTDAQWQLFKNRASDLSVTVGRVLLPTVNNLLGSLGKGATAVAEFAEKHEGVTKAVITGVATLTAGSVGVLGTLYTVNRVQGAVLALGKAVSTIKAASAARGLGKLATSVGDLDGAAGRATKGIGGFLGKLGAVGLLSSAAFAIGEQFGLKSDDEIAAQGKKPAADLIRQGKWLSAANNMTAGDYFRARKDFVFGGKSAGQIADGIEGKQPPALPAPAARSGGSRPNVTYQTTNQITITGRPGESDAALADRIARRIDEKQAARNRSSLRDRE